MLQTWSAWRHFPISAGDPVPAPAGPGVYEIRHGLSGRAAAFGDAANVAQALTEFRAYGVVGPFARFRSREVPRVADLEYRVCAAATRAEARSVAARLMGMRNTLWRKRVGSGFVRSAG